MKDGALVEFFFYHIDQKMEPEVFANFCSQTFCDQLFQLYV